MRQIAIFADAGYLYAQGAGLVQGASFKPPRMALRLDVRTFMRELVGAARKACPDGQLMRARILRTYWYDDLPMGAEPDPDQMEVAVAPFTKLRLGMNANSGQEEEADSPIASDLIELARNRAITDALILSGNEDMRMGVQIAQSYGVQVHLLGINPGPDSSFAYLVRECDTSRIWGASDIRRFLFLRAQEQSADGPMSSASGIPGVVGGYGPRPSESGIPIPTSPPPMSGEPVWSPASPHSPHGGPGIPMSEPRPGPVGGRWNDLPSEPRPPEIPVSIDVAISQEISAAIARLDEFEIQRLRSTTQMSPNSVPSSLDRPTLARIRNRIRRHLTDSERKLYRGEFMRRLAEMLDGPPPPPPSENFNY
ncbi:MAG: NYN domain-containing protein [Ectothiorhodospiraceae bacterium AqS1]|nr:NYN domain-containing protein [Ectothiorhodospiraceae bacterium AqS1]